MSEWTAERIAEARRHAQAVYHHTRPEMLELLDALEAAQVVPEGKRLVDEADLLALVVCVTAFPQSPCKGCVIIADCAENNTTKMRARFGLSQPEPEAQPGCCATG